MSSYEEAIKMEEERCKDPNRSKENLSFYHKNLGLALYHNNEMERALEEYGKAIALNPENADNYFNRGNVKLNQEEFDAAHEDFQQAIAHEGKNAKFYHAKGLAYQAEAEQIAREGGDAFREKELVNQAILFFQLALTHCATFISSMFHLGLMYRRTERFHEALQEFSKVEQLLENDKTIYIQKGLVY